MVYFVIYVMILSFAFISYRYRDHKRSDIVFLVISFMALFFVSGFRDACVGIDTASYHEIFYNYQHLSIEDVFDYRIEAGYGLLNKLSLLFSDNPQSIVILSSLLFMLGMGTFIYNNSNDFFLSTIIFLANQNFLISLNISRQFLAIMFICNAYTYLKKKKIKLMLLMILGAALFHRSAIVFFFIYLILVNISPNKKNFLLICTLCFGIYIFLDQILIYAFQAFPVYQHYVMTKYFGEQVVGVSGVIWMLEGGMAIWSTCFLTWSNENDKKEVFLLASIVVFSLCFSLIGMKILLIGRLSYYCEIFMMIFIPKILKKFKRDISFVIIYLVLNFFLFIRYSYSVITIDWLNYKFFFE